MNDIFSSPRFKNPASYQHNKKSDGYFSRQTFHSLEQASEESAAFVVAAEAAEYYNQKNNKPYAVVSAVAAARFAAPRRRAVPAAFIFKIMVAAFIESSVVTHNKNLHSIFYHTMQVFCPR